MKVSALSLFFAALLVGLPLVSFAGPTLDTDGDGVFDLFDNCTLVMNAGSLQCDGDNDGYGNFCDGDINNDSAVSSADIVPFKALLISDPSGTGDINCDTATSSADIVPFKALLSGSPGGMPGPSGYTCAGTVPCP